MAGEAGQRWHRTIRGTLLNRAEEARVQSWWPGAFSSRSLPKPVCLQMEHVWRPTVSQDFYWSSSLARVVDPGRKVIDVLLHTPKNPLGMCGGRAARDAASVQQGHLHQHGRLLVREPGR